MSNTKKLNEITTVQAASLSPMQMMIEAKNAGLDVEQMRQMLDLQKDWEANEARKNYHLAVAAFKAEEIKISKDKRVGYTTKDGEFVGYSHASLANIVELTVPFLSKHGLSHNWIIAQDGAVIKVTCTLAHEKGYSQSTTLQSTADNSGKKNPIQAIASAITYLERYTFLAITGLATKDMEEDDGAGADKIQTNKVTGVKPSHSTELPEYTAEQLDKAMPAWKKLVAGGKAPGAIIAIVSTKYILSDEQKKIINNIGKVDTQTGEIIDAEYTTTEEK